MWVVLAALWSLARGHVRVSSLGRENGDCFWIILDWGLVGWVLWVLNLKLLFKELGILVSELRWDQRFWVLLLNSTLLFAGLFLHILNHMTYGWPTWGNFTHCFTRAWVYHNVLLLHLLLFFAKFIPLSHFPLFLQNSHPSNLFPNGFFSDTPNIAHYNTYLDSFYTLGSQKHMRRDANQHIRRCPADQDWNFWKFCLELQN